MHDNGATEIVSNGDCPLAVRLKLGPSEVKLIAFTCTGTYQAMIVAIASYKLNIMQYGIMCFDLTFSFYVQQDVAKIYIMEAEGADMMSLSHEVSHGTTMQAHGNTLTVLCCWMG